jgi:hypothetical protein
MPESPSATPSDPLPRSLAVKQPEWAFGKTERKRRAGASADRQYGEQSRREQARQHAVVAAWLRDLVNER